MGLNYDEQDGQTPLDEDEKEGLQIATISTRGELDEFEQQNIEEAVQWSLKQRSIKPETFFTKAFVRALHKRMYGQVWTWAGEFRRSNKNIGVDKWQIPTELRTLLDDARFWVEKNTFPPAEIAIRFKHRLVAIHCFPNGNGRHSRLIADILMEKVLRQPVFTWGAANLVKQGDTRTAYLVAVRAADKGSTDLLLAFAKT